MSRLSTPVPFPASRYAINGPNLSGARNATMLSLLGNPRGSYSEDCQWPTNPRITDLLVRRPSLGPLENITGLRPAVAALEKILDDIRTSVPHVHAALGHEGMLCARFVRGSRSAISNHSWGTAIDLTLEGKLDTRGDGKTQAGLLEIYSIFNAHGFFWGAAFSTEDAMHFEASDELIHQWAKDGAFGKAAGRIPALGDMLTFGDRGKVVEELQVALNLALAFDLAPDGIFGAQTRAAVLEFQRRKGLPLTGEADTATRAALEEAVS
ncbi:MAG: M15 family metallopeptidase [Rhizobiales bacterium]|nr:M15 family metallopeptidase [Hyphomicrobiales bacterium]